MLYKEYINNRRQYQEQGRDLLLEKKHACLFYSPGKGKTYPVIDALYELRKEKGEDIKVLIISTADAIRRMWEIDIVPQNILPKNTYLVTDRTAIGKLSALLISTKWDVIIVDECHIVKAHNSKIHRLVYKLCRTVEYAWGLTGTPRGNRDVDIWCQLQALHIGGQGKMSYTAWTRIYCTMEVGYGAYGKYEIPTNIKDKYLSWWDELLETYCMFVDYDEDDDMPELNVNVIKIPYVKTKEYENAFKGILEVGDFATTTTKMVAIMKAYQACNGYLYLPDKTIHRIHRNKKLDYLEECIGSNTAVIVYKHIADYEDLANHFGDMATNEVDKFKTGYYKVLLLQCGHCKSFNLQNYCSKIIFYTMDYSFIKYKQMIHRLWRLGQKLTTEIIVLQHENTIEHQVWQAVTLKQKAHDLYMSIKESSKGVLYG